MFLHVSVILFTRGDGGLGVSASVHARIHIPQEQNPPPGAVDAGRCGQQTSGMHPTGMHTCFFVFLSLGLNCVSIFSFGQEIIPFECYFGQT